MMARLPGAMETDAWSPSDAPLLIKSMFYFYIAYIYKKLVQTI